MAKLTLTDIASGYDVPTTTNANNDLVEAAVENTLSRDGTSPNSMEAQLDMNSNRIINLANGVQDQDAATVAQIQGSAGVANSALPALDDVFASIAPSDGDHLYWDDGNSRWDAEAPAAAGAPNAFATIDCPAGTDPVADSTTDTLTLASGDVAELTITGDSGTDTVTFAITSTMARKDEASTFTGQVTLQGTTRLDASSTTFNGAESVVFNVGAYTATSTLSISTGVVTLDCDNSNSFSLELTENVTSWTLSNLDDGQTVTILLSQDAGGANTVAWTGLTNIKWVGGSAGVVSSGSNQEDLLTLHKSGSNIYATLSKNFS